MAPVFSTSTGPKALINPSGHDLAQLSGVGEDTSSCSRSGRRRRPALAGPPTATPVGGPRQCPRPAWQRAGGRALISCGVRPVRLRARTSAAGARRSPAALGRNQEPHLLTAQPLLGGVGK